MRVGPAQRLPCRLQSCEIHSLIRLPAAYSQWCMTPESRDYAAIMLQRFSAVTDLLRHLHDGDRLEILQIVIFSQRLKRSTIIGHQPCQRNSTVLSNGSLSIFRPPVDNPKSSRCNFAFCAESVLALYLPAFLRLKSLLTALGLTNSLFS